MWICQKISLIRVFVLLIIAFMCATPFIKANEAETDSALNPPVEKHLVLLLVPGLSFSEIEQLHDASDYKHWETGTFAVVNLKPDGNYSYLNNTVSLASGKRALGIMGWNGFEKGETWEEVIPVDNIFHRWHGYIPNAPIIHPQIHELIKKNEKSSFHASIGWFGTMLKEEGVKATTIGNSDTSDERIRYGSLFVMDQDGEADGSLHDVVVDKPNYPGGKKMSVDKIIEKLTTIHEDNSTTFTVIEWGDLHRFFHERTKMTDAHADQMYEKLLFELDQALSRILHDTSGEVWLLSPAVNDISYKERRQLGPLWIWDETREKLGNVYSSTTRRDYLVSNTDVVPTLAERLGLTYPQEKVLGSPLRKLPVVDREEFREFSTRIDEINKVFANRGSVLSSYISGLVAMLVIVSCVIWFFKKKTKWKRLASTLLLSGVLSPFWFLITVALVLPLSSYQYVLVIIMASVLSGLVLNGTTKAPFSVACAIFFVTLTVDVVVLGSFFTERSFLSYDPVIGARYYGIGNEYAGIFIVSGLLLTAPLLERERLNPYWTGGILLLIVTWLIGVLGSASFGANAGASLATGVMFLYVLNRLFFAKKKVGFQVLLFLLFFVGVLITLYMVQLSQPISHITIGFQQLLSGDWQTILQTISRKLQMNWKIFKVSYWTQLFITSYFLIGLILWRRRKEHLSRHQDFLINCCIVASLALLVLNDSGIVAAATSMFITLSVCYGWSLSKKQGEANSG
ncbi:hypothetical protein [Litchfieldia alkalitelluris]|nr:hypothetical protein [Litchfieldia alkalitelluris]